MKNNKMMIKIFIKLVIVIILVILVVKSINNLFFNKSVVRKEEPKVLVGPDIYVDGDEKDIYNFEYETDGLVFRELSFLYAPGRGVYVDLLIKNTSKKVRKTFENNARNGLFTGGFAPYGYIKDLKDKHKLLIDPYAADVVRYIFNQFVSGNGLKSICHALDEKGIKIPSIYKGMNRGLKSSHFGLWTTKTISDMLHNPTYAGHLTQHKSKAKNISSKKKVKIKPENWIIKYNS